MPNINLTTVKNVMMEMMKKMMAAPITASSAKIPSVLMSLAIKLSVEVTAFSVQPVIPFRK